MKSHKKVGLFLDLAKRTAEEWSNDGATRWSASLAFYTLISLAPLLLVMVAIAGFVYGKQAAQGELVSSLRNLLSGEIADAALNLLALPHKPSSGFIAVSLASVVSLVGASSVLTEIHDALNAIWHVPASKNVSAWVTAWRLVKERLYSFAVIIGCGLLLALGLLLSSWLAALEAIFGWRMTSSSAWFHLAIFGLSLLVITFVFAAIYKLIPDVELNWGDVTVGGGATAILFVAGKQLIGLYLTKGDLGSAYGASGSLIVLLLWLYYSAQVFFLGAEFTKVYAQTFGSRKK